MSCFQCCLLNWQTETEHSLKKGFICMHIWGEGGYSVANVIFCVEKGLSLLCCSCSLLSEVRRGEVKHLSELIHSWQREPDRGARINTIEGRSDTYTVRALGEVQSDRGCVRQSVFQREKLMQGWGVCECVWGAEQERMH